MLTMTNGIGYSSKLINMEYLRSLLMKKVTRVNRTKIKIKEIQRNLSFSSNAELRCCKLENQRTARWRYAPFEWRHFSTVSRLHQRFDV